ncbi:IS21 family transposase [Oceanirhabdus sp. W0125-5]|uniref:IS21 family transposase n=1 Tax=Oceanirhabdus sp. W0125-5 TaxID=2999116 RepID=UPI0022F32EFD|nr:IS21 family transposase [Oceanirhabdus sp. W0125-5]WBW94972.1 IS21 family transposase [Oceanirhabdus sp. W0125-5]WBW95126.1 IS21 family transposase [Oceanirhabdus sp. W0125-5]WBW95359.1 IS21 family transposase [Oceanirhabdus sp. W0125-5]WBW95800.1 IS21 family transposase [Oceanirhabdus sp. W0125-5]WBW98099.1 IS21 family transposase [Oceanirhabdus sp. W0125-5]
MRKDVSNQINLIREEIDLLNKSELARRFNCDRRTIDKYLTESNSSTRKPRVINGKLDDYKEIVKDKADNYGSTSMAIFKFIQKKGYTGGYQTVNSFVKKHRKSQVKKATIRFDTSPGLQAQVDWKESIKMINKEGEVFEVNIFLMVLGYSRLKYLKLTMDRTQKTLFECLFEAFRYYQGIPKEILFDNMSTVVDRNTTSFKNVSINKNFKYFSMDAGFDVITCRPYRPQTKGKVETLAKLVDRLTPFNEEFNTFEDLEKIVESFNHDINSEISQATNEVPFIRFEKEKEYLNPLPTMDILLSYFHHEKEYKVSNESMIRYKGKKYSVPTCYIGCYLTVSEIESELYIYYTKDLVACHKISDKTFHYKKDHAKEILLSNALSHYAEDDVELFIEENLKNMDIFLEE